MQSLRRRESDKLRGRICKIFLAFTLSCNFVSNNKGQKGKDYNPAMHIRLIRSFDDALEPQKRKTLILLFNATTSSNSKKSHRFYAVFFARNSMA